MAWPCKNFLAINWYDWKASDAAAILQEVLSAPDQVNQKLSKAWQSGNLPPMTIGGITSSSPATSDSIIFTFCPEGPNYSPRGYQSMCALPGTVNWGIPDSVFGALPPPVNCPTSSSVQATKLDKSNMWWVIIPIIVLILSLLIYYNRRRRQKK